MTSALKAEGGWGGICCVPCITRAAYLNCDVACDPVVIWTQSFMYRAVSFGNCSHWYLSWMIRSQADSSGSVGSHLALRCISSDHLWSDFISRLYMRLMSCLYCNGPFPRYGLLLLRTDAGELVDLQMEFNWLQYSMINITTMDDTQFGRNGDWHGESSPFTVLYVRVLLLHSSKHFNLGTTALKRSRPAYNL